MTAAGLRSGDTICLKGKDVKLCKVKRKYPRGTGVYQFKVVCATESGDEIIFSHTDRVLIVEKRRRLV